MAYEINEHDIECADKFKKRINKLGPLYLLGKTYCEKHAWKWDGFTYEFIFNMTEEGEFKTKLASLSDHHSVRYGIGTSVIIRGDDRINDVWKYKDYPLTSEILDRMYEVRNGESKLPIFNIDQLVGLRR